VKESLKGYEDLVSDEVLIDYVKTDLREYRKAFFDLNLITTIVFN
jgi:hypothetical protein